MAKTKARRPSRGATIDPGAVVVAVASLVAFLPALSGRFVWDDFDYVRNNPILHAAGWNAARGLAGAWVVGNYHPVTMASLMLDRVLFGWQPAGFHVTSLILHTINAVLVGRFLLALDLRRDAAWAGALLWAVHPLRVESVAWISARKDLLYVFFFLVALLAYVRHVKAELGPGRAYLASLGAFAGAVLSKSVAVVFVPVMFIVDWFLGRRLAARTIVEKGPFAAIALVLGIVAIAAQRTAGAIPLAPARHLAGRLAWACYGLVFYLVKTVAPWGLSAFYPYPKGESATVPVVAVVCALGVAAAAIALVVLRSRMRPAIFAALFYVTTLALVLQVIPVGGAVAADRYSYLPAVAVSFVIAQGIAATESRWRNAVAVVVVAAALALACATWVRCGVWRDPSTLWSDVLAKHPGVPLALENRGVDRAMRKDHRGAIADFDAAIAASPGYADAWASRGNSKADLGDLDGAIADLGEAVRLDPRRPSYRFNLGLVLGDKGRWDDALASLSEAIRLKPDFAAAYLNRGLALEQMGRAREGAADVRRAQALGYPVGAEVLRRFP